MKVLHAILFYLYYSGISKYFGRIFMKFTVQKFIILFYNLIILCSDQAKITIHPIDYFSSDFKLSNEEKNLPDYIFHNDYLIPFFCDAMDLNNFENAMLPESIYEILLQFFGPMSQGYIVYNTIVRKGTYLGNQDIKEQSNIQKLCILHTNINDTQYDDLLNHSEKALLLHYRDFFNNPNNQQDKVACQLKQFSWYDFIVSVQDRLDHKNQEKKQIYLQNIKHPLMRYIIEKYAIAYFSSHVDDIFE
jgi:hypothetical protein